MVTVGSAATDWANDGLFGDGWHLFGIGSSDAEDAADEYGSSLDIINAFIEQQGGEAIDNEADDFDVDAAKATADNLLATVDKSATADYTVEDEETLEETTKQLSMLIWKLQLQPLRSTTLLIQTQRITAYGYLVSLYLSKAVLTQ